VSGAGDGSGDVGIAGVDAGCAEGRGAGWASGVAAGTWEMGAGCVDVVMGDSEGSGAWMVRATLRLAEAILCEPDPVAGDETGMALL